MSKEGNKVSVEVSFSIEGLRSAAKNTRDIREVVVDLPCLDPKKLRIDDTFYSLEIVPVNDKVSKKNITPSTLCTIGVIEHNVSTLSSVPREGYITINGDTDVPKELGRTNKLEHVFFETKEDARQVASVFLDEEYKKAEEAVQAAKDIRDFLQEQLEEERY